SVCTGLVTQYGTPQLVVVLRGHELNVRTRLRQLRLAQLHDRAEAEFISCPGQIERLPRLLGKLVRQSNPFPRGIRIQPRRGDVPTPSILQLHSPPAERTRAQIRLRLLCPEQSSIQERQRDVDSACNVVILKLRAAFRNQTRPYDRGDRRISQRMF